MAKENNSDIDQQLYRILRNTLYLIGFDAYFASWLKKDDKFVLVLKNYQNFLIFYRFYVWLIIHFEFGLNIYLLFDDKIYKNSESF
jgi:hypothetical protein